MARLAIVELRVTDWQSAVQWYRTNFELRVLMQVETEQYALLDAGDVKLAIKYAADAHPVDSVLLQWEVPDLDRWLNENRVSVLSPMKVSHEGYRRVIIEGPEQRPLLVYDVKKSAR